VQQLQGSLAKDQFIDALEDREIRMKIWDYGPKARDDAVSRALVIEGMYEAKSRRSKVRQVRVPWKKAAMEQMVPIVQRQDVTEY